VPRGEAVTRFGTGATSSPTDGFTARQQRGLRRVVLTAAVITSSTSRRGKAHLRRPLPVATDRDKATAASLTNPGGMDWLGT
jgi:hypothetical protein